MDYSYVLNDVEATIQQLLPLLQGAIAMITIAMGIRYLYLRHNYIDSPHVKETQQLKSESITNIKIEKNDDALTVRSCRNCSGSLDEELRCEYCGSQHDRH